VQRVYLFHPFCWITFAILAQNSNAGDTRDMSIRLKVAISFAIAIAISLGAALTDYIAQPKSGHRMEDGTVYVGISPTDGRPLYAMPQDLEDNLTWAGAMKAAAAQTFAGHADWRVATEKELNMLYRNRESIGGFQQAWYWSSSERNSALAWVQLLVNGIQAKDNKINLNRVRCVRSG
jgi:hypothetical protein